MRPLLCSLVFAAAVMGQTATVVDDTASAKLGSTLTAIGRGAESRVVLTQRLAVDMLALAPRGRQPSREVVTGFADELTASLFGKGISAEPLGELQQSILEMMRGSSATFASASMLRRGLGRTVVDPARARLITRRFMAIGEELRGPDDLPVTKSPFTRQAPQK